MPAATKKTAAPKPSPMALLREKMTKRYGEGRVVKRETVKAYDVIPTGSLTLDLALRVGGWPVGRIVEVVGQEGSAKTTLCIATAIEAQKKYPDRQIGFIDMEQTFDYDWAEGLGLDTSDERWLHVYPDNSEDVSDQIKDMMATGMFSVIIVDSIGGMESQEAFDKEAEDKVIGRNAQVITRMAKRCAVLCRKHQVTLMLVNQYRANIANAKGRDLSAGPKALKYATTIKVEMSHTSGDRLMTKYPGQPDPIAIGFQFRARVTRNKVAVAGFKAEFYLVTADTKEHGPIGIAMADEALQVGLITGVIEAQPGGYHWMPWTTDPKERIHGQAKVLSFLREHPEKALEVRDAAVAAMAADVIPDVAVEFTMDEETGELVVEV